MDPDQMGLHQKPAVLNLQCIQNKDKSRFSMTRVNFHYRVKPVLSGHSQKDQKWFSRPIIALCRSKVLQNYYYYYAKVFQGEHSAILSFCIKLPHGLKTFVLSIFEWPLKTGFTVIFIIVEDSGEFLFNPLPDRDTLLKLSQTEQTQSLVSV